MKALSLLLLLLISLLVTACSTARRGEPIMGPLPINDEAVNRGKVVFMHNCQKCHPGGEAGQGPALNDKPAPGIAMRLQVRVGFGPMPGFNKKEISHSEMNDLIRYLKALRHHKTI